MIVSFDTNILVYAGGPPEDPKCPAARELVARVTGSGSGVLVLQTLIEFSSVAMRKLGMRPEDVERAVNTWKAAIPVKAAGPEDLTDALAAVSRHRIHFWDALLWATAKRVGVRYLFSEDFQDGRTLDGVRFVNPFVPRNERLIGTIF